MIRQDIFIGDYNKAIPYNKIGDVCRMKSLKEIMPRNLSRKARMWLSFLPDAPYIRLFYYVSTGRHINLKNPVLFSEKQQWLKLHKIHPEYRDLVDKLKVNEHVNHCIGEDHVFPILGKWKAFDEIDFDTLPDRFVLKCNHDSGSTKIIRDKQKLSKEELAKLKKHFDYRVKQDYFYASREYPCKGIEPYIIAQQFMVDNAHPDSSIEDYKFFCFNGEPKLMFVASDRNVDVKFDFFDMDFNWLDIQNIHPNSGKKIKKPEHFEEMKEIAAKLSKGIPFVRIDLYDINGTVYFGEYTFFHGGGFCLFHPMEWERKLGDWIHLEDN